MRRTNYGSDHAWYEAKPYLSVVGGTITGMVGAGVGSALAVAGGLALLVAGLVIFAMRLDARNLHRFG
jgi:hypothetical protein